MKRETELVKRNYQVKPKREWKRLVKDAYHYFEFNTTLRFLDKHLPKKGLVLDAGGGPGRYTIELAKRGYEVVLLDIVPEHLKIAKKQIRKAGLSSRVKCIYEGDITDLSIFKDNSFDAVLCLGGPLSHVHSEKLRNKSISELVRVAKPKAPIFVSVMSRFGVLLSTLNGWPNEVQLKGFDNLALKGEDYRWRGNGYCHFFTLNELEKIFLKNKIKIIEKVGLEGFNTSSEITNEFAKKYPKGWKKWINIHNKLCTHPTVVDLSGHFMLIGGKR